MSKSPSRESEVTEKASLFKRTSWAALSVLIIDLISKWTFDLWVPVSGVGIFPYLVFRSQRIESSGPGFLPNGGVVLLSISAAAVFLSAALASHLFLSRRLRAWPAGLGLLAGGFFSNALDRLSHGGVNDTMSIDLSSIEVLSGVARWLKIEGFNFADIGELIGCGFLLVGLVRGVFGAWAPERRGRLLIERGYQIRFCLYLQAAMTAGFLPMFLSAFVIYSPTVVGSHPSGTDGLFWMLVAISCLSYLSLSIGCWSVGIVVSNRTAGAVVKFCRVLMIRTRRIPKRSEVGLLTLRDKDEFRERLEDAAKDVHLYMSRIERANQVIKSIKSSKRA